MAVTVAGLRQPKRITLGSSDAATQVTLPEKAKTFSLRPITNDAKFTTVGADTDPIGSDYATISADTWTQINVRDGEYPAAEAFVFFLASATGGTIVEVVAEE
jgi:hypothetical protein